MTTALTFNDHTLRVIEHDDALWIPGPDLAKALGYARSDKIALLYRRNADEFSPAMARILTPAEQQPQNEVVAGNRKNVRIYSLRGAHLIAMLADTPVAKQFRRWVLDVLEGIEATRANTTPPAPPMDVVPTDRIAAIKGLVDTAIQLGGEAAGRSVWEKFGLPALPASSPSSSLLPAGAFVDNLLAARIAIAAARLPTQFDRDQLRARAGLPHNLNAHAWQEIDHILRGLGLEYHLSTYAGRTTGLYRLSLF